MIPITAAGDYQSMFSLALTAAQNGASVTVTVQNPCNIDTGVETIQNIKIG